MENNMNKKTEETQLSFEIKTFLKSYKRLWWLSLVCAVVFSLLSLVYYKVTYKPQYNSSVKFTITPLVSGDASNGASVYVFNYNAVLATQMASTFPHVINSSMMRDIISYDLHRDFYAAISAVAVKDTNIFEVSVNSNSAQDAYDVVQSIMRNYPKVAGYIVGDTKMQVIDGSEPVMPTEPFNKNDYIVKVFAFTIAGVLVGFLAAFIDMIVRKVVFDKNDIETYFNGKCICEIPIVDRKRSSGGGSILKPGRIHTGFTESVRVLKQRVRSRLDENGVKIIGVTSTVANEGKTTIAYNLARSLSSNNVKVLLIDMDLHGRDIQNTLNRKKTVSNLGIVDVVTHKANITDVINSISDTFDVLFAGEGNVKFRKEEFIEVFAYLREQYDYIIVDMPSVGIVPDTISIADLCDELLYVIKANSISPKKVYDSLTDLAFSNAALMGFVLNEVTESSQRRYYHSYYGKRRYGYGYSYGYFREGQYGNHGINADTGGKTE